MRSSGEFGAGAILAVAGAVLARYLKSATTSHARVVALALFLICYVTVIGVYHYAQRRQEPAWTVRSYLKTDKPWAFLALAFVGFIIAIDPANVRP